MCSRRMVIKSRTLDVSMAWVAFDFFSGLLLFLLSLGHLVHDRFRYSSGGQVYAIYLAYYSLGCGDPICRDVSHYTFFDSSSSYYGFLVLGFHKVFGCFDSGILDISEQRT